MATEAPWAHFMKHIVMSVTDVLFPPHISYKGFPKSMFVRPRQRSSAHTARHKNGMLVWYLFFCFSTCCPPAIVNCVFSLVCSCCCSCPCLTFLVLSTCFVLWCLRKFISCFFEGSLPHPPRPSILQPDPPTPTVTMAQHARRVEKCPHVAGVDQAKARIYSKGSLAACRWGHERHRRSAGQE